MICRTCPTELAPRNTSGRCRTCANRVLNADPEHRARQRAGIHRHFADPAHRAASAARLASYAARPDVQRQRQAHGRRRASVLVEFAREVPAAMRAENGRKRSETVLSWCPPEWRDTYRDLTKRGRRAAEAKRITLDLIAGKPEPRRYDRQFTVADWCPADRRQRYDFLRSKIGAKEAKRAVLEEAQADRIAAVEAERARIAAMSPFERQLERVRNGAALVPTFRPRSADLSYTPGGVASGML